MLTLELKERKTLTKTETHQLRTKGFIPGVIYGGEKNLNVYASYGDFIKTLKKAGRHDLIEVKLNDKKINSLIKDFQLHPVTDVFTHFDMLEVSPEKELKTKIPVEFVGKPAGLVFGGVLEELQNFLMISVKAKDLPHVIQIDISKLNLGDSIHVKDVVAPKGVKLIDAPSTVIVMLSAPKAAVETAAAEETAAAGTATTAEAGKTTPSESKTQEKPSK